MEQQRVAFWFGADSEVHYVAEQPQVGDYVIHGDELWIASRTGLDDLGAFVLCRHPHKRRFRHWERRGDGDLFDRAA